MLNAKFDELGRPRKRSFGSWMLKVFQLLSHGKRLCSTVFDPFGRHPDRKQERALIREYRELVELLLSDLRLANHSVAVDCASLPDGIHGYGEVKSRSISKFQRKWPQSLSA